MARTRELSELCSGLSSGVAQPQADVYRLEEDGETRERGKQRPSGAEPGQEALGSTWFNGSGRGNETTVSLPAITTK